MIYSSFKLRDAKNISFIGACATYNQKVPTVIECYNGHQPVGIEFVGICKLLIENMQFIECQSMNEMKNLHSPLITQIMYPMSVIMYNCFDVMLQNVALFDGDSRIIGGRLIVGIKYFWKINYC